MGERNGTLTLALVLGAFLAGGFAHSRNLFPFPHLRELRVRMTTPADAPPPRFALDEFGRLVADRQKQPVDCPQFTGRTAVLLVAGQSNAANFGGQAYAAAPGDRVVNFFGGKCYRAASPLLGAEEVTGEYWTQVGNLLVERGAFDRVVIAVSAVGGTDIARWAPQGDLHPLLLRHAHDLKTAGLTPTHFLWVQGESDHARNTPASTYSAHFHAILNAVRTTAPNVPAFPGVATFCAAFGSPMLPDNAVANAQRALPDSARNIFAGVDSDRLLTPTDRRDDCHFGGTGSDKAAAEWANILIRHAGR